MPLAFRLKDKYNISYLCTDGYEAYKKFQISQKHTTTKAETALVESKNSLLRHYLARLNRKTKRYSKAIDMLENAVLMFFNKELLFSIFI